MKMHRTSCCGLRMASGVGNEDPKIVMLYMCRSFRNGLNAAFVIFANTENGPALVEYILKNKLGKVKETTAQNENGRYIRAWLYEVNRIAIKSWYNKNK